MIFEMSRLFSCDWDPLRSTSYKIYENRPLSAVDRPRLGKKSIPSYIQDATLGGGGQNRYGSLLNRHTYKGTWNIKQIHRLYVR